MNANRTNQLLTNTKRCSNHEFLLEQPKNYQGGRNLTQILSRGPTTWKVVRESALKDIVSWRTRRQSSCTTSQLLAWTTMTSRKCRLGLFQDSDFAGDLEDSKSTSGGTLCVHGSHTFVPISWMCRKQTSVPHSSTKSEVISSDAGLRMDGLPALDLWDVVIFVLRSSKNTKSPTKQAQGNLSRNSNTTLKKKGTEMLMNCQMWITLSQT